MKKVPTAIKEVLKKAIEQIDKKQQGQVSKEEIARYWESAAGKEASRHSSPAQFKGKTLLINVDSSIWIYQLNIKKKKIEEKLSRLLKHKAPVKIRLRAGER